MPFFNHNHHRLFYREQGAGPLLLILPGNTASSACHLGELDYFASRYHTVALDFWGTGQSDRLEDWPVSWWSEGAQDAAALVQHLGKNQALVMGCSGGTMVALLMAILNPDCVQAVVADSEVEYYPLEWMRSMIAARKQRTPGQVGFWSSAHGADWEQVIEADSAMLLRTAESGGDLLQGRLRQIQCPVLFTASLADSLLPDVGKQVTGMAAQVSDSQVYLVNAGDHPLMWSQPVLFHRNAMQFLESLS
jgi:pimeloyl-ACP methyl ester carboxylesterase